NGSAPGRGGAWNDLGDSVHVNAYVVEYEPPCTNSPLTQWTVAAGGNGHFYQVLCAPTPSVDGGNTGGITWTQANAAATAAGGYLATFTTSQENAFFSTLVDQPQYWYGNQFNANIGPWFGLSRPLPCGSGPFAWVTGEPFNFNNWAGGEPNCSGGVEHLASFYN